MVLNILEKQKIVEVWLTKAEKNDPALRENLKKLYARYKGTKYTVAVYESGENDLYDGTLALLSYNKRKSAEMEARRERESSEERPSVIEKLHTVRPPSRNTPTVRAAEPER